ncbi:unnamed protein product [Lactuca saligna]|uniref:Uncharacterized protein n=1 Tax=Lactuca saligna TaxID=75948 RepID=A0AA36E406_LACSI|nr:unnamed protein product [Lactuca saligna]
MVAIDPAHAFEATTSAFYVFGLAGDIGMELAKGGVLSAYNSFSTDSRLVFDSSILRRVPLLYHRFCQSIFISIGFLDSTVNCSRVDFAVDRSQVDFMVVPLDLWVDRFLDFALSPASSVRWFISI